MSTSPETIVDWANENEEQLLPKYTVNPIKGNKIWILKKGLLRFTCYMMVGQSTDGQY